VRTSTQSILTTHAGSLVKPRAIREALAAQQAGKPYDEESFRRQLADAVTEVVREQADAGVDVPSDGEFGKAHWVWYVTDRLAGVEPAGLGEADLSWWMRTNDRVDFAEFYAAYEPVQRYDWSGDPTAPLIRLPAPIQFAKFTGPVSYKGAAATRRDIENFKAALAERGDLVIVPPGLAHAFAAAPGYDADILIVIAPGVERFEYFRHLERIAYGKQPPESLLEVQELYDTYFQSSSTWDQARALCATSGDAVDYGNWMGPGCVLDSDLVPGLSPCWTTASATVRRGVLWSRACARRWPKAASMVIPIRSASMPFACSMMTLLSSACWSWVLVRRARYSSNA
jgi:hypothetical protein